MRCQRCDAHEATEIRADSVLEWAHGEYQSWCECCVLDDWIRRALGAVAKVPEWKEQLAVACGGRALPDQQDLIEDLAKTRDELHRQWVAAHYKLCGEHYPGQNAINYAAPHPPGEHCYWPEPVR